LSDYLIQLLAWLKQRELASTWADVSGFVIAIVGFGATLLTVLKTKDAATKAQRAAQEARNSIRLFDTIVDFSSAIAILEEIKRAHRLNGISDTLPDRYAAIRKQLIVLRSSSVALTDEQQTAVQEAIVNLRDMEKRVEKALSGTELISMVRFNSGISKNIDRLVEVLTQLKLDAGETK
jgi:hypothetical protein